MYYITAILCFILRLCIDPKELCSRPLEWSMLFIPHTISSLFPFSVIH